MISQVSGTIIYRGERFVIVDVGGVGYKVFVTADTLDKVAGIDSVIRFWTHQVVREDALELYGFLSLDEQEFFEMLISISGIGPKTALSILNLANISTLKKAVASGDATYLTKVSGIGKKNAEKIVLELKDKLLTYNEEEAATLRESSDALEALKSLGYSERESRDALKKVPKDVTDPAECVKRALKILNTTK